MIFFTGNVINLIGRFRAVFKLRAPRSPAPTPAPTPFVCPENPTDHPGFDAWGHTCALYYNYQGAGSYPPLAFCASPEAVFPDPEDKDAAECTNADNRASCTMTIAEACPCMCGLCACACVDLDQFSDKYGKNCTGWSGDSNNDDIVDCLEEQDSYWIDTQIRPYTKKELERVRAACPASCGVCTSGSFGFRYPTPVPTPAPTSSAVQASSLRC